MKLHEVAGFCEGKLICNNFSNFQEISGISIDSRTIQAGQLFVAIKGSRYDGHDFLGEIISKGACAAIVSQIPDSVDKSFPFIVVNDTVEALQKFAANHRRNLKKVKTIVVTGSCGKTTTKEMIGKILCKAGKTIVTSGNENNHIGLPLTLCRMDEQTEYAVCEAGCNHFGEIETLTKIADPDIGLITCVAPTHVEFLGSEEGVARAKSELFSAMRKGTVAVVNLDDPWICRMPTGELIRVTFTISRDNKKADITVIDVTRDDRARGQNLVVDIGGKIEKIRLEVEGIHNVANAASSIAVAYALGISVEKIVDGLSRFRGLKGRGMIFEGDRYTVIDESYNSSPAAAICALETLYVIGGKGRKVAILGDMLELGEKAGFYHELIGQKAAMIADFIIGVGKYSGEVIGGAIKSGKQPCNLLEFSSVEEAIGEMKHGKILIDSDIILVKGSRAVKMEKIVELIKEMDTKIC